MYHIVSSMCHDTIALMDERILIVDSPISLEVVESLAKEWYVTMIKGVADCNRGILALGGDWHMDANTVLTSHGSTQSDVWGFNINLHHSPTLEYTSLINIRPDQHNRSMNVEDMAIQERIKEMVRTLIPELSERL